MIKDLKSIFDKYNGEYLKFELITEYKPYNRSDLCAFHLLDAIAPSNRDIIESAEHDKIWLDIDCNQLAEFATEDHIKYLCRCGVMYNSESNKLSMFV
jgi:hypothetical protein